MNKFDQDKRYQGVVFQGTMNEAIAQAKAAPDHDRQTMDSVAHAGLTLAQHKTELQQALHSNVIQFPVRK